MTKPPRKARRKAQSMLAVIVKQRKYRFHIVDEDRDFLHDFMQRHGWLKTDYRIARVAVKELP